MTPSGGIDYIVNVRIQLEAGFTAVSTKEIPNVYTYVNIRTFINTPPPRGGGASLQRQGGGGTRPNCGN
jgi:hypothetical protein